MITLYFETEAFCQAVWHESLTISKVNGNYLLIDHTIGWVIWTDISELTSNFELPHQGSSGSFDFENATEWKEHLPLLDKLATFETIDQFITEYPEYFL